MASLDTRCFMMGVTRYRERREKQATRLRTSPSVSAYAHSTPQRLTPADAHNTTACKRGPLVVAPRNGCRCAGRRATLAQRSPSARWRFASPTPSEAIPAAATMPRLVLEDSAVCEGLRKIRIAKRPDINNICKKTPACIDKSAQDSRHVQKRDGATSGRS